MKTFTGQVISTKMSKTATVVVERVVAHPIYRKRYKILKKYHVHDPVGVQVGQTVVFVPSRPYSKLKKWIIKEIVNHEDKPKKIKKNEAKKAKKGKNK